MSPHQSSPAVWRSRLRRLEHVLTAVTAVLFAVWTWLVLSGLTDGVDDLLRPPRLAPRSALGQITEAFALVTHPFVVLVVIAGVAVFSFKQRMRRLSLALGIGAAGIPLQLILAAVIGEPHPRSVFGDSISALDGSYPAGHVTAVALGAWMLTTLTRAHRRPTAHVGWGWALGAALTALTCVSQWTMGLATISDIIGGLLLGSAVGNLALSIGGVDSILAGWARLRLPEGSVGKHAAVVLNPTKFDDLSLLRRRVESEVLLSGWQPTVWLETTADDPGHAAAQRALEDGADLVVVAGGDGTVRAVSAELTGTGTPMALLPSGTGNLLARNLGIPLDTDAALRLALHGTARPIDVVEATADGSRERFVVMAGMGMDARIMEDTNDDLKKVMRSGAYAVAAVQNAVPDPFTASVSIDGAEAEDREIVMALLGNVGTITAGMTLFPEAQPDDGTVDLMLASPQRTIDWARLGAQVLTGREMRGFETTSGARIRIATDHPVPFEIDGDTMGEIRELELEVLPGALEVVQPDRD